MAHDRHRVAPFGNPGISLLDGSSWLIAVIPRPSSARSAKASTVRRSHLTCATPRACTAERKPVPEVVAHLEAPVRLFGCDRTTCSRAALFHPRGKSGTGPRLYLRPSAVISACHQNHTRTPRASPAAASNRLAREFPAAPLDVSERALATRSRGDAVDASHHYVPCQGASRGRSPRRVAGTVERGVQEPMLDIRLVGCQQAVYTSGVACGSEITAPFG